MADKQNRPDDTQRQNPTRQQDTETETQRREGQSKQGDQQRSGGERERTSTGGAEEPRNKPEGNVEGTEDR